MTTISNEQTLKQKKIREAPHPFIILFVVVIVMAALTYLIPAGQYERVVTEDGRSVVVDGSYTTIDSKSAGFLDVFNAIHKGMVQSAPIIFFIFIVAGSFNLFRESRAIEGAFGSLSTKMKGKEMLLIPVIMLFFGFAGAGIGMFEEVLPFIMILVPIAIVMGFDSMVGAAMVIVGVSAGFTAAFMNPFTIGVAQGLADVPIFSGMGLRIVFWIVFMIVSIGYVMIYARKIKKDPTKSIMYEEDRKRNIDINAIEQDSITKTQVATLVVLGLTLIVLAVGVLKFGWFMTEIAALFLIMAIVMGLINRMNFNEITKSFVRGCEELVVGALVVGFAYGALVILNESNTIDTVLYGISNLVEELPSGLTAIGMYLMQTVLNVIVSSGSGQAALTMPIMAPLSDLLGVSRQTAVLAFQMGDGITNIITPTSGLILAALAMAKISYGKWVRWLWPLIVIQFVLGGVFITVAHLFFWPA
ncbi:YfcC family protein [Psychrobacillus sp. INOP01]|uniref:YfcC family protein n=1 Tax=Psychrobacillus sp. INOP01 TaxID=2829187 RepID=UPI001BA6A734|nr:AbgT family transporter [Psychrobacillus sp. INOP01]QUG42757.1 YfcC family protein [Psychrobacillus sp. INOP01]